MNLETKRLKLENIVLEDIKEIYEYSKEKNVGPNAGWKPHESIEETEEIAKEIFINKKEVWGIKLKDNNQLIGTIGLINDTKRDNLNTRMVGYAISEKYWGNGFMPEALERVIEYGFEDMGLELISAYCYPFNKRSQKVLEKCNFEYEGTLKRAEIIYNGNVYDNICYSILKDGRKK